MGELIRYKRRIKELSIYDLAEAIGCDARTVQRWESNTCQPSGKYLMRIMKVLDIKQEEIIDVQQKCGENF